MLEAIRDGCSHVAPQLAGQAVALRVDVPPAPVWGMVDAVKLRQVVINLMSNAIRLTERGYVQLKCEVVSRNGVFGSTSERFGSGPGVVPAPVVGRCTLNQVDP